MGFGAENIRFNERILLDIMYIDEKPILRIVTEETKFIAAQFLPDVSTQTVWRNLLHSWAIIHTELPNHMLVAQGSAFRGKETGGLFVDLAALFNVEISKTGVEAHYTVGLCERYHQPLRHTYRKIMVEHPTTKPLLALAFSVKAMNGTLGREGPVPSALVFREYPRPFKGSETPGTRITLAERSNVAQTTGTEMSKLMAKVRISRALKHSVPSAADQQYNPGDEVLVWRENLISNKLGEWIGPFDVTQFNAKHKLVFVREAKIGVACFFNFIQVKRYHDPEVLAQSFLIEALAPLRNFGKH